jgi:molybdate transport system substrate-binding protein
VIDEEGVEETMMLGSRRLMVTVTAAASVIVASLLAGCGADDSGAASNGRPEGELLVFAAASLTDAFTAIEAAFEDGVPEVDVRLNFAGSATLREQIIEGAPASVFASADRARMDDVVDAELIAGTPAVFAANALTIAVPTGNPRDVSAIGDFADGGLLVGACALGVPCGDLAADVFIQAGVEPSIDTYEPDVRALLAKIADAELDTGLVYVTDVAARADAVESVALPPDVQAASEYPIATLLDAPNPSAAAAFVEFVLSDVGRTILSDHGFEVP